MYDDQLICIKTRDGQVMRIKRREADALVAEKKAVYVPRHVWRASRPKPETKEALSQKQSEKAAERKKKNPKK